MYDVKQKFLTSWDRTPIEVQLELIRDLSYMRSENVSLLAIKKILVELGENVITYGVECWDSPKIKFEWELAKHWFHAQSIAISLYGYLGVEACKYSKKHIHDEILICKEKRQSELSKKLCGLSLYGKKFKIDYREINTNGEEVVYTSIIIAVSELDAVFYFGQNHAYNNILVISVEEVTI
ncbi:hypothetical protein [Xenorhabdus bovienii]|uniref:Uncharacterized protein n=1 Tax=Xenorhabdus bovienii str. feltiae Moldova TaxID=1398200 RepID=A0A077NPS9_XENBV|nr:hypothetical protein [Xenorhabdus bovienii]CDH00534.1 hypothetical protein XBFM1_1710002 [Xenorhabdus bovienii str. feltiae Moldova]